MALDSGGTAQSDKPELRPRRRGRQRQSCLPGETHPPARLCVSGSGVRKATRWLARPPTGSGGTAARSHSQTVNPMPRSGIKSAHAPSHLSRQPRLGLYTYKAGVSAGFPVWEARYHAAAPWDGGGNCGLGLGGGVEVYCTCLVQKETLRLCRRTRKV